MTDVVIPQATELRVALVRAEIARVLGAGSYLVHVRTDLEPWQVAVLYPGQRQAMTAALSPEQASDPGYRHALARAFCAQAVKLRWLEDR